MHIENFVKYAIHRKVYMKNIVCIPVLLVCLITGSFVKTEVTDNSQSLAKKLVKAFSFYKASGEDDLYENARTLLKQGITLTPLDSKEKAQALYLTLIAKQFDIVDTLINQGLKLNDPIISDYYNGATLFHLLAGEESKEILEYLLHHEVPINKNDNNGLTALDIAELANNKIAIDFFEMNGGIRGFMKNPNGALFTAAMHASIPGMQKAMQEGGSLYGFHLLPVATEPLMVTPLAALLLYLYQERINNKKDVDNIEKIIKAIDFVLEQGNGPLWCEFKNNNKITCLEFSLPFIHVLSDIFEKFISLTQDKALKEKLFLKFLGMQFLTEKSLDAFRALIRNIDISTIKNIHNHIAQAPDSLKDIILAEYPQLKANENR